MALVVDENEEQFKNGDTITFTLEELKEMEAEDWEPTKKVLEFERRHGIKRLKLESGTLKTMQLLSNPELAEKLIEGKKTPLAECIPDNDVIW